MPKTEKKYSSIRIVMIGVLLAVIIMLAVSALGASLVNSEKLELDDANQYLTLAGGFASCLLASQIVSAKSKEKQFLTGLIPAGLLLALRVILRAFSGEGSVFDPMTLKMLPAFAAGGAVGAVLGTRRKKKHRRAHSQRG